MDDIERALRRCVSACTVSIKRCLGEGPVPLKPSQPKPQPKPFTPTQEELIRQLGHELEVLRSEQQAIVDARSPNADMLLRQLCADVVQLGNRVDELPFIPSAGSPEPRLRERRRSLVNAVGAMEASIERRLESMSKTQQRGREWGRESEGLAARREPRRGFDVDARNISRVEPSLEP